MAKKAQTRKVKAQIQDQTVKGGVLALLTYIAVKVKIDPELVMLCMPLMSALFAFLSTKIGDPALASFLSVQSSDDEHN